MKRDIAKKHEHQGAHSHTDVIPAPMLQVTSYRPRTARQQRAPNGHVARIHTDSPPVSYTHLTLPTICSV
eukprot:5157781-Prymnesium_polylepis.1